MTRFFCAALLLLCVCATPTLAQMPPTSIVTTTASATPAALAPGGRGTLRITLSINPRFHVNAHDPRNKMLIPTTLSLGKTSGVVFGPPQFPVAKTVRGADGKNPLLVYVGTATITVPFKVAKTAAAGARTLTGTVNYQGCTAVACFPPDSAAIKAQVTVK
ncbi:MAG: protein-disulfide reductase DsbD N-terminal domain-containing protein [Armatimonadota bacterium]|nr:protein-disulfide reductase DsbD N-terminal domain-containing protein [Armatimonadota bacterium]